jgi:hypothetical protein
VVSVEEVGTVSMEGRGRRKVRRRKEGREEEKRREKIGEEKGK